MNAKYIFPVINHNIIAELRETKKGWRKGREGVAIGVTLTSLS